MNHAGELKINIGAGKSYIPGFRNIDISKNAEIVIDLANEPLPFEDRSVDLVFSYHTIEHVSEYLYVMGEIFRVLKDGGIFLMGVPYITLTEFNLVNPYHVNHFNEHSFAFFDPKKLRGSAEEGNVIYFHQVFQRIHYIGGFKHLPPRLRRWCRRHLFNVASRIDFGVVAVKSDATLSHLPTPGDLRTKFDTCQTSRVFYSQSLSKKAAINQS